MKKEIERKYLVFPDRLPRLKRGQKIVQAYLSTDPVVRARIKNKKGYLTIKFREGGLNIEYDISIPIADAKSMIYRCSNQIEKTRYNIKVNGNVWEIDVFEGANKGLIIAEIELKRLNEEFQRPLWISKEVTTDKKYWNVSLAYKPYNLWG
ncbi:CYTH domain-containing protein [Patescibacteria group bacterium]|nr:CYTH domain-containing protein [Patescibacteria group bacterium]